jgi:hypothetical protein
MWIYPRGCCRFHWDSEPEIGCTFQAVPHTCQSETVTFTDMNSFFTQITWNIRFSPPLHAHLDSFGRGESFYIARYCMKLFGTFCTVFQSVCALARDFLQEQDFTGSNLIRTDHVGEKLIIRGSSVALEVRRCTPLRNANTLEQPPWKMRRFFAAPAWRWKHARANSSPYRPFQSREAIPLTRIAVYVE